MDFGQKIETNTEIIIQRWIDDVRDHDGISSAQELTYTAIRDDLPDLMKSIAQCLSAKDHAHALEVLDRQMRADGDHGEKRARQGFDAEEIVREFAVLKHLLLNVLEPDLLACESSTLLVMMLHISNIFDTVVSVCLERYTEERRREVNMLYSEMLVSNRELDRLIRNEHYTLSYIAHEIKNPLSCIIGYSDLFLRQPENNGKLNIGFIERVLTSGRQLLQIINNTLEASSYGEDKVSLSLEDIPLCAMLDNITSVMDTLAQQKGLRIYLDCPADAGYIHSDRTRLRQVMVNILSNAVRYTDTGEISVKVLTNDDDGIVQIAIADTGQGISIEDQKRIFEPYYQGKAGQNLPSSTGLGLAIADQTVKLLQGDIHLISKDKIGSTFTVILPREYRHVNKTADTHESTDA